MKFRKASAAVLAAALAIPTAAICASADAGSTMETEIKLVKERIDIPNNYSEFNYTTETDCGKTRYNFTWSDPSGRSGENISVSVTGKVIKSVAVNKYVSGEWSPSLAKLSNEELLTRAKRLAIQINPTIADKVDFRDASLAVSLHGDEAVLRFRRKENSAVVLGQTGKITINKNTGELISYNFTWINCAVFKPRDGAISKANVKKSFRSLFPVELVYVSSYDYDTHKTIPHLIYRQTETGYINAFTGKLSAFTDYDYYGDVTDSEFFTAAGLGELPAAGALTWEESAKASANGNFVSAEEMFDILKNTGILYIPTTSVITGKTVQYDEDIGCYVMNVDFTANRTEYSDLSGGNVVTADSVPAVTQTSRPITGSFSVNASSGELLSFSCTAYDTGTKLDKTAANKLAAAAVKQLAPSKAAQFSSPELKNSKSDVDGYDMQTAMPFGTVRGISRTYTATRLVNGIKFDTDTMTVSISNTGYVVGYSLTYHDGLKFPSPANKISKSAAYNAFFEQTDFGQVYRCAYNSYKNKVGSALVYYAANTMNIDAITGKLTSADGTEITAQTAGEYTDIAGTKYEQYAKKLAVYGITLMDNNGKLDPDKQITFGDLNTLISKAGLYFTPEDGDGLTNTKKLSRKLAAKVLAGARFGREACELRSVFRTKFTDVGANNKYLGYIAYADASGMIKGSGGTFSPNGAYTRGEALIMVYKYLDR